MRVFLHGGPRTRAPEALAALAKGAPRVTWLVPSDGAAARAREAARQAGARPGFLGTWGAWALRAIAAAGHPAPQLASTPARRAALERAVPLGLRDASERLRLATRALLATPFPGGRDGTDLLLEGIAYEKGDEWRAGPEFPALFPELLQVRAGLDVVARAYDGEKRPLVDEADALLELRRLLRVDPAAKDRVLATLGLVVVSDFEETTPLERALLQALAPADVAAQGDASAAVGRRGPPMEDAAAEFRRLFPAAEVRAMQENARTHPRALDGVRVACPEFPERAPQGAAMPGVPRLAPFDTPAQEARYVAGGVGSLFAQRTPAGSVAVLYRGPEPPAALAAALGKARVPVTGLAGLGDPRGETARAVSAYLQWVTNPAFQFRRTDRAHQQILAALIAAHRGVSLAPAKRFTEALGAQGDRTPAPQAIQAALAAVKDVAVGKAVERLLAHRQEVRTRASSMTPAMAVREARAFLAAEATAPTHDSEWDFEFIDALEGTAKAEESIGAVVAMLDLWREGKAVSLIPTAQAKGLTWDHVFVVGCAASQWPSTDAEDRRALEARWFAGAATAATKALTITYTGGAPSPFLAGFLPRA